MREQTLKEILLKRINETEGWLSKGQLYLVGEEEEYSPETVGRQLRTLAESGEILADYYKGKRGQTLAKYAKTGTVKKIKPRVIVIERNGERFAMLSDDV